MNLTIQPKDGSQTDNACSFLILVLATIMLFIAIVVAAFAGIAFACIYNGYVSWPEILQLLAVIL